MMNVAAAVPFRMQAALASRSLLRWKKGAQVEQKHRAFIIRHSHTLWATVKGSRDEAFYTEQHRVHVVKANIGRVFGLLRWTRTGNFKQRPMMAS